MVWWLWLLFGLVLLIIDVQAVGNFYLMFFGAGALAVGLLALAGAVTADWLEWVLFTLFSVTSLLLFRARVLALIAVPSSDKVDSLVGEVAVAVEDIPSGGIGKVELRGTVWSAKNESPSVIAKAIRCKVTRVEGLTLCVLPT